MTKRVCAIWLAITLVVCAVPMASFAEGSSVTLTGGNSGADCFGTDKRSFSLDKEGDKIYLADNDGGLKILDAATMQQLNYNDDMRDQFSTKIDNIEVDGNLAYIVGESKQLYVVDLTSMQVIFQTAVKATRLLLHGDYLFLAATTDGLKVYDISGENATAPVEIKALKPPADSANGRTGGTNVQRVRIDGDNLYLMTEGGSARGVFLYSLSDVLENEEPELKWFACPEKEVYGGFIDASGKEQAAVPLVDFAVYGDYVITGSKDRGILYIMDVSNPDDIQLVTRVFTKITALYSSGKYLFTQEKTSGTSRFVVYDITKLVKPGMDINNAVAAFVNVDYSTAGFAYGANEIKQFGDEIYVAHNQSGVRRFTFTADPYVDMRGVREGQIIESLPFTVSGHSAGVDQVALSIGEEPAIEVPVSADGTWSYDLSYCPKGTVELVAAAVGADTADTCAVTVECEAPDMVSLSNLTINGAPADALESGSLTVGVSAQNNTANTVDGILLGALYNGGQMVQLQTVPVSLAAEGAEKFTFAEPFAVSGNAGTQRFQAFILKSPEELALLSNVVKLPAQSSAQEAAEGTAAQPDGDINLAVSIDHTAKQVSVDVNVNGLRSRLIPVLVMKPNGTTFADAGYVDVLSDNEGSYSFSYTLEADAAENQDYTVSAGVVKLDGQWYQDTAAFRYYGPGAIAEALNAVKNATPETLWETAILPYVDVFALEIGEDSGYAQLGEGQYQDNVLKAIAGKSFATPAALRDAFNQEVIRQAALKYINEETDGSKLTAYLDENAASVGIELHSIYEELSADGKTALGEALVGMTSEQPFADVDSFTEEFAGQAALALVNTSSWEEMGEALETANDILELPLSGDYADLRNTANEKIYVHKSLTRQNFKTLEEIRTAFANAVREATPSSGNGGGSSGGSSGGSGGRRPSSSSGGSSGLIAFQPSDKTDTTPQQPSAGQGTFSDMADAAWAQESVEALSESGIIDGYPDGTFRPNEMVTREQFVKMLVAAFDLMDDTAEASFSDVAADDWFYPYVASAAKLGITQGDGTGRFGVGACLTRQEMAVLAYRAAETAGAAFSTQDGAAAFTDEADIAGYAVESVKAMQQAGVISGMPDGSFQPQGETTRAMAAKVIASCIELAANAAGQQ